MYTSDIAGATGIKRLCRAGIYSKIQVNDQSNNDVK